MVERTGAEERLKDLDAITQSLERRWWMVGAGAALIALGSAAGLVRAPVLTIGLVAAAAVVANVVAGAAVAKGWYRRWYLYLLALLDLLLAGGLVVFFGPGGYVVAFYLAVLPYAFDHGRGMGDVLVLAGSLVYLAAAALHGWVFDGQAALSASVYFETVVFVVVALALRRTPASLVERIRAARGVVAEVEAGTLGVRAPATRSDELGFLERSLNRMLDQIAETISAVQREADEAAAFAEVLAQASAAMLASSERVTAATAELAAGMTTQQQLAAAGQSKSTQAANEAAQLSARAERTATDARRLVDSAARGRSSVARASETLLAIGREVRATATTVQELSGLSERIGAFSQAIAKIARQTHLLALNAAIEAARAEAHGAGFAAVAEQVRTLAGEAGRSARDVGELIQLVRAGVDAVARAMAAGEEHVRDVGVISDDARRSLEELHAAATQTADLVTAAAEVCRAQAAWMAEMAEMMSQVAQISVRSAQMATDASQAVRSQREALESLHHTGRQLAALAERLRAGVARFTVLRPEHATSEHPVVR